MPIGLPTATVTYAIAEATILPSRRHILPASEPVEATPIFVDEPGPLTEVG